MSTLALDQAQWQPPRPGGLGIGAVLALIAHALLVLALAVGVAWRSRPSEVVMSAELWSAVPEVAAPAPVEPPPKPKPRVVEPPKPDPRIEQQQQRDAQIALEKAEKKKRLEKEQEEKLKEQRLKEEKLKEEKLKEEKRKKDLAARQKAEEERLAKLREENLARIRGLAGASGPATSSGQSLRDAAPSASYAGRILARIKPNIVLTSEVPDSAEVTVEVKCAPDGRISSRRIVRSTGHALYEEAVLRAIDKAEVLPKDTDGRVPATMTLVFKRKE